MLLAHLLSLLAVTVDPAWPLCSVMSDSLHRSDEAMALANRFAPVLEFAPGEPFFPTVPFFSAFDGVDNDRGGNRDFADPEEVAPDRDPLGRTSTTRLNEWYRPTDSTLWDKHGKDQGRQENGLRRGVVHFRICRLTPTQVLKVRRFLMSDEQAYDRFEQDYPLSRFVTDSSIIDVIQYYLYYLRDAGLQGHPHDVELVSVFLPRMPSDTSDGEFRIVVGSGHSPRTPNNVLVLSAPHRGVGHLDDRLFVLVELGGHSSAPDMPPYGRFTPGVDVNWHIYDVWGTRDVQAIGGIGYLGRYRPEVTFDRDADAVRLYPPRFEILERECVERTLKAAPACDSAASTGDSVPHSYRLVPVSVAVSLDSALERSDTAAIIAAAAAYQDALCGRRTGSGLCENRHDSLIWSARRIDEVLAELPHLRRPIVEAMRAWREPTYRLSCPSPDDKRPCLRPHEVIGRDGPRIATITQRLPGITRHGTPASKHRIWEHENYRGTKGPDADPTIVFKSHLFRPTALELIESRGLQSLLRLFLFGGKAVPGDDAFGAYTGFVIPAWRSLALPVRFAGFMEVHAGVLFRRQPSGTEWSPDLGLVLEGHRNAYVSWYGGLNWITRRKTLLADPAAGEFALSGGVSLLPWLAERHWLLSNAIRIRVGARIDPFRKNPLDGVRWELQVGVRQ